jgi:hypothetical protein
MKKKHRYLPYRDSLQETLTGMESRTLFDLNFRTFASLLLETREENEVFEEFDAQAMQLKARRTMQK